MLPNDPKSQFAALRGKRAAVLLYSTYPGDPRPKRAVNAMVEAGMQVDLFCLGKEDNNCAQSSHPGLSIYRIPMEHERGNKLGYLWQYTQFIFAAFWFLARKSLHKRYDVVHVHNMPDFLVFSALLPKLQGARIVLDMHDPMPELMMSIYGLGPDHTIVRILRLLERCSLWFADVVLTPNLTFKEVFVSRGCPPGKIQIIMNSPEASIFNPEQMPELGKGTKDSYRLIHHGSIFHRHGIDLLVEAIARVRGKIPGIRLDLYGDATPFLDKVMETAHKFSVADIVQFHGGQTQAVLAQAIHHSHLGIIPNRRSSFTELNFPTRIFEYLAMNRALIAPATRGIKDYFKPDELLMFEPGNVEDLAAKILWAYENPEAVARYMERGRRVYFKNLWTDEKRRMLESISGLTPNLGTDIH